MRFIQPPVTPTRQLASLGFLLAIVLVSAPDGAARQTPPPQPAPPSAPAQPAQPQQPQPQQQQPAGRVFGSDAGMIFNPVKPDKTADFEMIMGRLKEALKKSENAERKQQAASWKVFKSVEPGPNNSVLYVFVMDPAVKGADYTVAKILSEVFPTEVQELYKVYSGSYSGGQSLVNLQLVSALGQ